MKAPLFVRELTAAERRELEAGLRSRDAFTVRRCQILLGSADGKRPSQTAAPLGCAVGTVRNAIGAFAAEGPACLERKPSRAKTRQPVLTSTDGERLKAILHQSPRHFGKPRSTWSLKLLAEVACEQSLTPRVLSHEAMRQAVRRLGIRWKRAKRWITSPDPADARKKKSWDRLIRLAKSHPDWVLGFQDDLWWSRLALPALPAMHDWSGQSGEGEPLQLIERAVPKEDPDPKALACYGLLRADTGRMLLQMLLRFVQGRPVSQVTEDFLEWVCGQLAEGKRAIVEPDRLLTADEVVTRVHEYYHCEPFQFIAQQAA